MFNPRPDLGRPDGGLLSALRAEPVTLGADVLELIEACRGGIARLGPSRDGGAA